MKQRNKEKILRNKNQRYHQNLYPCPNQNKKTFDDYFEECIKNKKIPKDSPSYLKKALERAMKEYDVGIKHEKSALENFVDNYVIEEEPGVMPFYYSKQKNLLS